MRYIRNHIFVEHLNELLRFVLLRNIRKAPNVAKKEGDRPLFALQFDVLFQNFIGDFFRNDFIQNTVNFIPISKAMAMFQKRASKRLFHLVCFPI